MLVRARERKREIHAARFDFRRPDRIPKSQVRAIHVLHDTFVHNLASSLSAFLRTYLTVNMVSVEQLSYGEFLDGLPSPTCLVALGLSPYDGSGVMEVNPSLVFPILEMLLGGSGKTRSIQRDITEIEQRILDGLFRIVLNDLREAWKPVTAIDFAIESMESEPQLLGMMARDEAVVAIGIEIKIGDVIGMLNLALPSIVIKVMRNKFDHQWTARKPLAGTNGQARMFGMLRGAPVTLDIRLEGQTMKVRDLLALKEGHLLAFDYPVARLLEVHVNGAGRFSGHVVSKGPRRACLIEALLPSPDQGRISDDVGGAAGSASS
jgi:flagellar motor switch protein FliM